MILIYFGPFDHQMGPGGCKYNIHLQEITVLIKLCSTMNPGPVNLGFVNSRSIGNKGLLIGDTIVSNNLDTVPQAPEVGQLK